MKSNFLGTKHSTFDSQISKLSNFIHVAVVIKMIVHIFISLVHVILPALDYITYDKLTPFRADNTNVKQPLLCTFSAIEKWLVNVRNL